ncbi:MAG: recombinase family protein [Chloroflexi bacterium]|nr:recombinase family protein [Chloroflexota bacterium]
MFQILGSIGEYEKGVITERMTLGRDRVARTGEWLIATVPLGYDVIDGRLAPSDRLVQGAAVTEADLVRDLFARIAGGSTTVAEARRLNTLGVPSQKRTLTKVERDGGIWRPDRIRYTIRNTAYRGQHTINSGHGRVERDVVPLVSPELWQAANERLTKNRSLSTKNAKRRYLLRGLVRCQCGCNFVGAHGKSGFYYRCGGQLAAVNPNLHLRCNAKLVNARRLEQAVWNDCREFISNPGEALAEAQAQLRQRMEQSARGGRA